MAEPSDHSKNWTYGKNPYHAHETGELGDHWILLGRRRLYLRVTDDRSITVWIKKNDRVIHYTTFPRSPKEKKGQYDLSPGQYTLTVKFSTGEEMEEIFQVI